MRYVVEIERVITVPMVIDARSKRDARALATQALQNAAETDPETAGALVVEAPCIRSVRMPGG